MNTDVQQTIAEETAMDSHVDFEWEKDLDEWDEALEQTTRKMDLEAKLRALKQVRAELENDKMPHRLKSASCLIYWVRPELRRWKSQTRQYENPYPEQELILPDEVYRHVTERYIDALESELSGNPSQASIKRIGDLLNDFVYTIVSANSSPALLVS